LIALTETEVHPINARVIELAARFKACWTFHRFREGLQRFFGLHDLGPIPVEFQSLYKRLKGAPAALDGARWLREVEVHDAPRAAGSAS
jgi:hypothetical protein